MPVMKISQTQVHFEKSNITLTEKFNAPDGRVEAAAKERWTKSDSALHARP